MDALNSSIKYELSGNKLKLEVDLKDLGPTSSGKATIFATTRGSVYIPGTDYRLGLNITKK